MEPDPAGTPLAMTDQGGTVVWRAVYKPFGEEQSITGTVENNEKFVGKEKDKETGLYYFGARYMEAKVGRFISPDPVGPVDPRTSKTNYEMLANPQKLNRYAYSLNNPYKYFDPDGRLTVYIWSYRGKNDAWGHASLTLESGTHISWWPRAESHETNKIFPQIYTAPAYDSQTYAKDAEWEGQPPDAQIKIMGLDEKKIEAWWQKFKQTNKWNTLNQNCSTTAADALKAGGGEEYSSWWSSHSLIWTPSDVKGFADSIKENIEKRVE